MGRILMEMIAISALLAAMATSTGAVVMGSPSTVVGATTIEGGTSTTSIPGVWLASQSRANLAAPAVTNAVAARADGVTDTRTPIVTVSVTQPTGVVCDVKDGSIVRCVTPVPTTVIVTTVTRVDWSGAMQGLPTASEGRCDKNFEFNGTTQLESSPLVLDCIELAYRISGPGEWRVTGSGGLFHQLVEWRTCAFGLRSHYDDWAMPNDQPVVVLVGNQDIIDIIRDSILAFSESGRVAATGRMWCKNQIHVAVGAANMEWSLFCNYGKNGCANYAPFPEPTTVVART